MTKFFQAFPAISTAIAKDLYDIDLNLGLPEHMGIYYHRIRGGTSLQNLKFWRQVAYDNRTEPRFYDHGPEKNFQRYGSVDPPSVDFKQIEVPLAVFNGKYDNAVPIKDSLIVKQSLKEETLVYYSHDSAHDHGGFIFSCNMSYFQDIISLLHKHLN